MRRRTTQSILYSATKAMCISKSFFCTDWRCGGLSAHVTWHLHRLVGRTWTRTHQRCQRGRSQLRSRRFLQKHAVLILYPWYLADLRRLHQDWSVSMRQGWHTLQKIAWRRRLKDPLQSRWVRGLVCRFYFLAAPNRLGYSACPCTYTTAPLSRTAYGSFLAS